MEYEVSTAAWKDVGDDWLIVPVTESQELTGPFAELDDALGGSLGRLQESGDLTGEASQLLPVHDVPGIRAGRLLLLGLGRAETLSVAGLHRALMTAARHVSEKKPVRVAVVLPTAGPEWLTAERASEMASTAFTIGCVGQGLHQREPSRYEFSGITFVAGPGTDESAAERGVDRGRILGESVNLTRELINRPADEIYPETFADRAGQVAREYGLGCQIFDERRLQEERMGAMLAVAQGSDRPPRMIVVEHRGGGDNAPTLALVGKGVTYDSGGLSLKPSEGMKTMKGDMAGAATVLGAVTAIAGLNLPVNVTGFMGMVENMPSGKAYKLGDVLTARNGVTVEVMNTDAEGRLVLADVLSYAVDQGVDKLVDLATLTGSCVVALGEDVAGVFTNDQDWADRVLSAARTVGEDVWQLPMDDFYAEPLKSDVADCKNVGTRWGGAIQAAKFLEKFVGGQSWVHLDIAGPAFLSNGKAYREGGATGCMVRTLIETAGTFAE